MAKVGEREQAEQRERWDSTNVMNSIGIAEYHHVGRGIGGGGGTEGNLIRMRSKPPKASNDQKRTEPNEGGGFGKTLPTYDAGEDDAQFFQCRTRTRDQTTRSIWPRQRTGA